VDVAPNGTGKIRSRDSITHKSGGHKPPGESGLSFADGVETWRQSFRESIQKYDDTILG